MVKITSFLVKVVLKIYDIFWNCLGRVSDEVIKFCCIVYRQVLFLSMVYFLCNFCIYSFPVELFQSQGHSSDTLALIENAIFNRLEPLLLRLLKDSQSLKVLNSHVCFTKFLKFYFIFRYYTWKIYDTRKSLLDF